MNKYIKSYGSVFLSAFVPAIVDGLHSVASAIPDNGIAGLAIKVGLTALLGLFGARSAHKDLDSNQQLAQASGEAGAAAGKGPFVR